jgi:hypothetical protein
VNSTQVPGSEVVKSIAPLSDCSSGRSSSGFFSSLGISSIKRKIEGRTSEDNDE